MIGEESHLEGDDEGTGHAAIGESPTHGYRIRIENPMSASMEGFQLGNH